MIYNIVKNVTVRLALNHICDTKYIIGKIVLTFDASVYDALIPL